MKKVLKVVLILFAGVLLTNCDDDNGGGSGDKVTVNVKVSPANGDGFDVSKLEGMEVTFTDTRTLLPYTGTLDASGDCTIELNKGVYNISIEENDVIEDLEVVYMTRLENVSISEKNQIVPVTMHTLPRNTNNESFIFSEIFFNGETNSGRMMHPDQYFVVYNPTAEDLYLDGLSVGVTYHFSGWDKRAWYDTYMPTSVPVRGFVTIPGSGEEHLLKAGERVVVAFTAANHSVEEGYDNAIDLSGADWEIYYGPDANDIDNPSVPNVTIIEDFWFQPRGYVAPIMFKLENGTAATIQKFYEENYKIHEREVTDVDGNIQIEEEKFIIVPTSMILDGVQTSDVPKNIVTRTIPETVDRGKFLVNGCHRQELAIRKTIKVGERDHYLDTNNSTEDFILQKGQNSFPLGWRNN